MEGQMACVHALSLVFAMLVLSAFGAAALDPATVTCKAYNSTTHQGMIDIAAALYAATRDDPKLSPLTADELGDALDKGCAAKPDAKAMDALH